MRTMLRGATLAAATTLAGAGSAAAHPGHVTHGGAWDTLAHALGSPYHVAVVLAAAVLAVAWVAAVRPIRAARRARREAEERLG